MRTFGVLRCIRSPGAMALAEERRRTFGLGTGASPPEPGLRRVQQSRGQVAVEIRVPVGGRTEDIAISILPKTPGVVVELIEEFQRGAIGLETKHTLAELQFLAADVAAKV